MNHKIILGISVIIFIISLFNTGFLIGRIYANTPLETPKDYLTTFIYDSCNNATLQDTVGCLNKNFNGWFIYNESNTGKEISLEEFKTQGGVCTHASHWYEENLKQKGYSTREIVFFPENYTRAGHMILLVWDYNLKSYCWIDQANYHCAGMG